MLEVDINKIIPVTEARDNFNKLVEEVTASDSLFVLTTNGKPTAVLVGVHHLEKLTGQSDASVVAKMSDLANNNLGGNMEDQNMAAAPVADDSAIPAAPADTTLAAAPADDVVAAPDLTPAAPVDTQIIPETPVEPVDDPFAASMPVEPEVPATPVAETPVVPAEAPVDAPEMAAAPEMPAQPAEEDGNVLPNIGGQA